MIKKSNINDAGWNESSHGEKFQRSHLSLTSMQDDTLMGCSAYKVKPGKRAFPKHGHLVNDEAIFVVSGTGNLTIGKESGAVGAGDYVWLPRGSKNAHILINDGDEDLLYLCMSTNQMPDVVHYPDSGKIGVLESKNFWAKGEVDISGFYRQQPADYWDGED